MILRLEGQTMQKLMTSDLQMFEDPVSTLPLCQVPIFLALYLILQLVK